MIRDEWLKLSNEERFNLMISASDDEIQMAQNQKIRNNFLYKCPTKINERLYGYGLKLVNEHWQGRITTHIVIAAIPDWLMWDDLDRKSIQFSCQEANAWRNPIRSYFDRVKESFSEISGFGFYYNSPFIELTFTEDCTLPSLAIVADVNPEKAYNLFSGIAKILKPVII